MRLLLLLLLLQAVTVVHGSSLPAFQVHTCQQAEHHSDHTPLASLSLDETPTRNRHCEHLSKITTSEFSMSSQSLNSLTKRLLRPI